MTTFEVILDTFGDESELWTMNRMSIGAPLPLAHLSRIERVDSVQKVDFGQYFGGYYRDPENGIGGVEGLILASLGGLAGGGIAWLLLSGSALSMFYGGHRELGRRAAASDTAAACHRFRLGMDRRSPGRTLPGDSRGSAACRNGPTGALKRRTTLSRFLENLQITRELF